MNPIGIVGTGSYLPDEVISNAWLARATGATESWIETRTGVRERRRAAATEATSDLAATAARRAMADAGIGPDDVTYVVVATSTPDQPQPATASIVQHLLDVPRAAAFDLNAVCSGFVYALAATERMLAAGADGYGLVIGADIYSRQLDYTDRRTAVLFGDGAGAVVLGPVADERAVLGTHLHSRGDLHGLIGVPAGGSRLPASSETVAEGQHYFRMLGREVTRFVLDSLPGAVATVLADSGTDPLQVRHVVPHQANGVMLARLWPRLALPNADLHLTVQQYGNTGAASIPITLDASQRAGHFRLGDLVLLLGFGGGMSVGAALTRWAQPLPKVQSIRDLLGGNPHRDYSSGWVAGMTGS
jgi:acetoacetyl-CoA synthase